MEGRTGDYHLIPRAGLRVDNEVWIVENGRVRIVPVTVVQTRDEDVFVQGDLADGDEIILAGVSLVTEGMQVEVATESEAGLRDALCLA